MTIIILYKATSGPKNQAGCFIYSKRSKKIAEAYWVQRCGLSTVGNPIKTDDFK